MRKFLTLFTAGVLWSALAQPGGTAELRGGHGNISTQGEETDWAPADLNRALTNGDKIWVEQGGRTEMQTVNSTIRPAAQAARPAAPAGGASHPAPAAPHKK